MQNIWDKEQLTNKIHCINYNVYDVTTNKLSKKIIDEESSDTLFDVVWDTTTNDGEIDAIRWVVKRNIQNAKYKR
jgi:hypothetical protein